MCDTVSVAVGRNGRHLFDTLRDPRVRMVQTLCEAVAPDLIVFPVGLDRRLEKAARVTIPERLRRGIAEGRIGLVFDASTEGVPHKPDTTAALHRFVEGLRAPIERCAYITQDRPYGAEYEAHCHAIGQPAMAVLTYDYWVWNALGPFADRGDTVYQARLAAFRARAPRRRLFLTLNRTPRPSKILLLLRMIHDGLWPLGHVSFGGFIEKPQPTLEQLRAALPGFADLVTELAGDLEALDAYGRVLLGQQRHGWAHLDSEASLVATDLAEYDDAWFSIVAETEMRARVSRITEKVIKPLVNFHPFIVFGNPGALAMIRSYGFSTFRGWCDEAYDEELDPRRRFEMAYDQVFRLCRLDDRALGALEARIAETLAFNAHWGLTQFPTVYRGRQDVVWLDALLELTNRPSARH